MPYRYHGLAGSIIGRIAFGAFTVGLLSLGVVAVIVGLPFYVLLFYLAHEIGWAALVFVAVHVAGGGALFGLQVVAGLLTQRALTAIFTVLGVLAFIIGFFATFPDLLRFFP